MNPPNTKEKLNQFRAVKECGKCHKTFTEDRAIESRTGQTLHEDCYEDGDPDNDD